RVHAATGVAPCSAGRTPAGSEPQEILMDANAQKVIDACEAVWEANKTDCNHFVRAAAAEIGITIPAGKDADGILDWLAEQHWPEVDDGSAAKEAADGGQFVIVGLKSADFTPPRT